MKIMAITDPDTALAFRLAGIESIPVSSGEDAASAASTVEHAAGQRDVAVILVTHRIADAAGASLERLARERHLPLFVRIPDITGAKSGGVTTAEKISALLGR